MNKLSILLSLISSLSFGADIVLYSTAQSKLAQTARTGVTNSIQPGDDGFFKYGIESPSPRFSEVVSGTETAAMDNLTGLMWTKEANIFGGLNWSNSIVACTNLTYAGYYDWRLPNIREMFTLFDYSCYPLPPLPSVSLPLGHPFLDIQGGYWTSTPFRNNTTLNSMVWYHNGYVYFTSQSALLSVWPVRGGL